MAERMLDRDMQPNESSLAGFLGKESYDYWTRIVGFIDSTYPGIFAPEWLYGGKHGWNLRYKKSKSFCTLIPERERLLVQIVFGAEERAKTEAILPELVSHAREDYISATTYHDGKWLALLVDGDDVLKDIERLLAVKRKPKV